MEKKRKYVPPTVEVTHVVLEGNIAAQSTVTSIKLEDWVDDPNNNTSANDADIVLPF